VKYSNLIANPCY